MRIKFFGVLLIILFISIPVFARERVVDNANILTAQEKSHLAEIADNIASAYNFDVVIVTERSIGDINPEEYAEDFFNYYDYGLGGNRDGILFLQVTDIREYSFSTFGRGIRLINNAALDKLEADTVKRLRANNPFEASIAFLQNCEIFLELEANGRRYNAIHRWNIVILVIAWIFAFIIGFLVVNAWKKEMNTALQKTQANAYVVPNSLNINVKSDNFLYSTVTKTRRQTQTSSSSGGSRTSSPSRSSGGRSGKF